MIRCCAWCGQLLAVIPVDNDDMGITHGICTSCRADLLGTARPAMQSDAIEELEEISCQVGVANSHRAVCHGNVEKVQAAARNNHK